MKKILRTFILLIILIGIYGCEEVDTPSYGIPTITDVSDITYEIGDDIPNYLNGVSAYDHLGVSIFDITVDDSQVDYDLAGDYYVYYRVTDSNGSKITATITITVEEKDVAPDYTFPQFSGIKEITYYIGQDIPNYKADITASDEIDGDLTQAIIYDESMLDFEQAGVYTIGLMVYDQSGNRKTDTFTITVIDNQKPIISGYNRIYHYIGDANPVYLKLINAYDQEDGDLNELIEVNDTLVDLLTPGIYPLYYSVSDSFGYDVVQVVSVQVMENDQTHETDELNLFYINDTHGSILEDDSEMGLAKLGNVILDEYTQNPYETLFLSGGDLLQGNVLSNYFYGSSMIDMFNYMNLDVFTLGNHEFDWGVDVITEYFNPNTLGTLANYPLLGANVFYKDTEVRPDYVDAYAVINKGDLKIGVVGVIGEGIESSIAKSRIEDYEFADPTYWTNYYTKILRSEYDVDLVFAIIHDNDSYYNNAVSSGYGDYKVDAIFNGHSHSTYVDESSGIPIMQSASNARALGHIEFSINNNQEVSSYIAQNLNAYTDTRLNNEYFGLATLINGYVSQIEPLLNEVIIYSSQSYGKTELTEFMAKIIREAADSDVGIHNSGGTRETLNQGQAMTIGTTYEIFPFDNQIISAKILGIELIGLINNSSVEYSLREGLNVSDIVAGDYYWVSTNDYVFGNYDAFQDYIDIYKPGTVDRIAFEDELRRQALTSTQFIID
ncbi:MAG: 5'-nucleotidase C-terminal domain-containing protein [Acholeplasmataceae bacterium]|nr:5'-nucleotidase C-terminal domain-containing protein [Acholeplasmataceae bacterium]